MLLVALWVRSYWRADLITGQLNSSSVYTITSDKGGLLVSVSEGVLNGEWRHSTYVPGPERGELVGRGRTTNGRWVVLPQFLFVFLAGVVGGAPWGARRYSLRALLIAATVVAVSLGVLACAARL